VVVKDKISQDVLVKIYLLWLAFCLW